MTENPSRSRVDPHASWRLLEVCLQDRGARHVAGIDGVQAAGYPATWRVILSDYPEEVLDVLVPAERCIEAVAVRIGRGTFSL